MRWRSFNTVFIFNMVALSAMLGHGQEPFLPSFPSNSLPAFETDGSAQSHSYFDTGRTLNDSETQVRGQNTSESQSTSPLPLAPPSKREPSGRRSSTPRTPTGALTTVVSSLAVVLGLFLFVAWLARRALPNAGGGLPKDVVEVLGFAPLANRQQMQLVRLGNKLVLLCVTATGADPLTEITDPEEVDRLAGLCQQNQPGSISSTFRQVLAQFGSESDDVEVPTELDRDNVATPHSLHQVEA